MLRAVVAPRTVSSRLLVMIALSIGLSLATVPLLKIALETALPGPAWLQSLVRYETVEPAYSTAATAAEGSYTWDVGRVSRRWLLLVTLAVFTGLRAWVPWSALIRRGFRRDPGWRRRLGYGVAMGLAMAVLYEAMVLAAGVVVWNDPPISLLLNRGVAYLLGAVAIALVEELFFRAVVFRSMLRDWGVRIALFAASLVFAVTHCISGSFRAAPGWDPGLGLTLFKVYFSSADGRLLPELQLVVGLFLLGLLLAYLYLRTGTVWASIGLHGAMVYGSRMLKKLWIRPDPESFPDWLFGDRVFLVSGVACWVLLLLILVLVVRYAPRGPLYRRLARTSR
jgi:membrane protease YdiL (CAAX protease family)